jgi:hypothetical protein
MGFVRFIVPCKDSDSEVPQGIVQAAYRLKKDDRTPKHSREALAELLDWIENNLAVPPRFNSSTSKGHYRRKPRGISWLRDTSNEHISNLRAIARIVREYGIDAQMITTDRVGYVIYEDKFQVTAEPFADTCTS